MSIHIICPDRWLPVVASVKPFHTICNEERCCHDTASTARDRRHRRRTAWRCKRSSLDYHIGRNASYEDGMPATTLAPSLVRIHLTIYRTFVWVCLASQSNQRKNIHLISIVSACVFEFVCSRLDSLQKASLFSSRPIELGCKRCMHTHNSSIRTVHWYAMILSSMRSCGVCRRFVWAKVACELRWLSDGWVCMNIEDNIPMYRVANAHIGPAWSTTCCY